MFLEIAAIVGLAVSALQTGVNIKNGIDEADRLEAEQKRQAIENKNNIMLAEKQSAKAREDQIGMVGSVVAQSYEARIGNESVARQDALKKGKVHDTRNERNMGHGIG